MMHIGHQGAGKPKDYQPTRPKKGLEPSGEERRGRKKEQGERGGREGRIKRWHRRAGRRKER